MMPFPSLGAVLAVVSLALAAPTSKVNPLVDPEVLVDKVSMDKLMDVAKEIQRFAYESPEKNRFIGTPGLERTMELVEEFLDEAIGYKLDYYDISRDYFEFKYKGKVLKLYNLIAQTKGGDPDNVLQLGAHMDSVAAGPGINDDASGGIALLEIAFKLAHGNYTVNNAVRFSWWTAEEEGLIGSQHYVDSLSDEERQKIRLYLNFDMIASPAGEFGIYTSEFNSVGVEAPPGVAENEKLFQDYFDDADLEWKTVALRGNSDHWPFVTADIPTGGLHAGADPNYHTAEDTCENLNMDVFFETTKAIAHAVGTYALSFDSLPPRDSL
ncbi:aminopeptidase Y [Diaporthe helianthi]|uniref:Peptide hydrolase n=1 Tax=Diaporthe helianthi TaxID=158607 RepID=A0A2P5HGF3_DIAHE|nr:aminopeptidase Y [Diaporthe helianthi]